jgi:hypothetical protein
MKTDTENFESLRRLLALKRHEQPPPGYFNDFSSQVVARIKAGEHRESAAGIERLFAEAPWLQRILAAFETKPILAGAFGAAVCALLLSGIVFAEFHPEPAPVPALAATSDAPSSFANATPLAMNQSFEQGQLISSTNPIAPPAGSLFDQFELKAQPVNFAVPGGH